MLEMHAGLYTLLKEFDDICKRNEITYYLEGGSLLGAVRHKGFLPWDDDVDLCITRDNFKKLLSVIDRELPADRELYCYERFPNYLRDTVKYTNLSTTVIFRNHILDGNACGQHIDLFILDPVPSDPVAQEEYKVLATIYSELMMPVYIMCEDIADYLKEYEQYQALIQEKGRDYVLDMLREKLFSYEDSEECDTYCLRWGNRHSFYPKAFFGTPVALPFEDRFFPGPEQYFRFLRAEFGDTWMMVPEEAAQEDHSTFDNYHVPCATFMADYSPYIDFSKAYVQFEQRKAHSLKSLPLRREVQRDKAALSKTLFDLTLQHLTSELSEEGQLMLEEHRYSALAERFAPYYAAQSSPDIKRNGVALAVSEPVLYAATLSLIMVGRYWEGELLLRVNRDTPDCDTPRIRQLSQLIADLRAGNLAAEEGRLDDVAAVVEQWLPLFPDQLDLSVFRLTRQMQEGAAPEELEKEAERLLSLYPESDRLLKLLGDLSSRSKNTVCAAEWYTKCVQSTRNGLFLMELADYLPSPEEPEQP
ncbi:MAG: LicD family protein [Oscillospiraceae bacterium]|nr:LicD family protein [Oscillospiraceae bacterium]